MRIARAAIRRTAAYGSERITGARCGAIQSRPEAFQVSVGQGEVDYGKLVTQLERDKYDRALTVHMVPLEGLDHRVELRKLRRLLETLM